jgi:hypothetical protein
MLSLKADGTPDQHNPEIVGDKEFALEATKEQFRQQAVSAVDQEKRAELFGTGGGGEQLEQDPKIAELKDAHDVGGEGRRVGRRVHGRRPVRRRQAGRQQAPRRK